LAILLIKEAEEKLSAGIKHQDMDQISVAHAMLKSGGQGLAVGISSHLSCKTSCIFKNLSSILSLILLGVVF